jgi:hypothetical protein
MARFPLLSALLTIHYSPLTVLSPCQCNLRRHQQIPAPRHLLLSVAGLVARSIPIPVISAEGEVSLCFDLYLSATGRISMLPFRVEQGFGGEPFLRRS